LSGEVLQAEGDLLLFLDGRHGDLAKRPLPDSLGSMLYINAVINVKNPIINVINAVINAGINVMNFVINL
jgi:hypothetical protein